MYDDIPYDYYDLTHLDECMCGRGDGCDCSGIAEKNEGDWIDGMREAEEARDNA